MKNNIEMFDEYVSKILGQLYRSFPIPEFLDGRKLSGDEELDNFGMVMGANGLQSKGFEVCIATIAWLREEGLISTKDGNGYGYSECVLTAKGLAVLKSTPESLKSKMSLGDALVAALRTGSKSAAAEMGKIAVGVGAGLLPGLSA